MELGIGDMSSRLCLYLQLCGGWSQGHAHSNGKRHSLVTILILDLIGRIACKFILQVARWEHACLPTQPVNHSSGLRCQRSRLALIDMIAVITAPSKRPVVIEQAASRLQGPWL